MLKKSKKNNVQRSRNILKSQRSRTQGGDMPVVGNKVWIPCEIKPGPFPDERVIRVESSAGIVIAFVREEYLRDPLAKDSTYVRAQITSVTGESFTAHIPGAAITSSEFVGDVSRVRAG